IYVVLGTAMEELSMVLLTMPVFFPVVLHLGFDPVWFGIIIVCVVEIGLISPPVGMNMFVLKTLLPEVSTGTVFRGVMPFMRAVGQNEGHASLGRQAERAPVCRRQKAVLRPAVDHESHRARSAGEAGDHALDVCQSHQIAPRIAHVSSPAIVVEREPPWPLRLDGDNALLGAARSAAQEEANDPSPSRARQCRPCPGRGPEPRPG